MSKPALCGVVWKTLGLLLLSNLALAAEEEEEGEFELNIYHINDFHARFEETDKYSGTCSAKKKAENKCFGGLARLYQKVEDLRREEKNVLFLNAGDMFQGTIWYAKFKAPVVAEFLNMMKFTASAIGNHEFDDKPAGLKPLVEAATFPLLCANCDFSLVSDGEVFRKVKKHHVVEVGGRKVGIIGYTTTYTAQSSSPREVTFSDELTAVKKEAQLLKEQGVDIIIGLGHVGYDVDKRIAASVPELDLVIGAHTHSFLYTGDDLPSNDVPEGPYPTIVNQRKCGKGVPVVQAYAYTKYLGHVNITFDKSGDRIDIEGKPLLLDSSYKENADILKKMKPYKAKLDKIMSEVVGTTKGLLERSKDKEARLGDLMGDAMLDWHKSHVEASAQIPMYIISLHNSGGFKDELLEGDITIANILSVLPFGNTIDSMILNAGTVKEAVELSAGLLQCGECEKNGFLQIAGMRFTIDLNEQADGGNIVKDLKFKVSEGVYEEIVDDSTPILVYMNNFLARGRDGYDIFKSRKQNHIIGVLDTDVLEAYIKKKSPIDQQLDGRITILTA